MNIVYCIISCVEFSLIFAYDDLSYKKNASQSPTYLGKYSEASNAVDGDRTTCMRTNAVGTGFSYPYKTTWWKVDLSGVYSLYSITILFMNYDGNDERQRGRFAGFSLYVSDNNVSNDVDIKGSTLCYKNGPQLPSLNFTTTCAQFGRFVIFYNERLDGIIYPEGYELQNIYTELCEVIIRGCEKIGVYGVDCNIPCPINCKDNMCHIQYGTCYACQPGWTGTTCSAKCRDGTYGYNCVNNCSGNCMNNSQCNKQTGHCDRGCRPGYTNIHCMDACLYGYFGLDCKKHCSGYCKNNESCDHVSGVCLRGCRDGYTGALCSAYCLAGYYGRNCSFLCSSNCTKCRHTDGVCITSLQTFDVRDTKHVSPPWIIGFSSLLAVNIIVISALIIMLRRICNRKDANVSYHFCCWKSSFRENQGETNDGLSHYQELSVPKGDNTYQTLALK